MAADNREQIMKDIESLSLEKYVDELAGAMIEGLGRCKTEKDVWGAVEVGLTVISSAWLCINDPQVISAVHRRFPKTFTPALISDISAAISAPPRSTLATLTPEQREKDDAARVTRQRPVVRVSSELALVGIIKDAPDRSGAEWIMKAMKDLVRLIIDCFICY